MRIDAKLPEGYVIICSGEDRAFLVSRLGLTVECPNCGKLASSAQLLTDFYLAREPAPVPQPAAQAAYGQAAE